MRSPAISPKVIALHRLDIEVPCTASWESMKGDERVRHCGDCNKNVFNLSAMPEAEAALLLANNDGGLCVRFYRRPDGTVMTSDCGTSVQAMARRTLRKLPAAAGMALLAASVGTGAHAGNLPAPATHETVHPVMLMGAPPAPPPSAQPSSVQQPQRQLMGKPKPGPAPVVPKAEANAQKTTR